MALAMPWRVRQHKKWALKMNPVIQKSRKLKKQIDGTKGGSQMNKKRKARGKQEANCVPF